MQNSPGQTPSSPVQPPNLPVIASTTKTTTTSTTSTTTTTTYSSNSSLPSTVQVQATINGTYINVTLNAVEGLLNNYTLNNKVYKMINSNAVLMQGSNLVLKFLLF